MTRRAKAKNDTRQMRQKQGENKGGGQWSRGKGKHGPTANMYKKIETTTKFLKFLWVFQQLCIFYLVFDYVQGRGKEGKKEEKSRPKSNPKTGNGHNNTKR